MDTPEPADESPREKEQREKQERADLQFEAAQLGRVLWLVKDQKEVAAFLQEFDPGSQK